jgi:hypothetical protein
MSDNTEQMDCDEAQQAILDGKLAKLIAQAKEVRKDDDEETLDQVIGWLTTTIECRLQQQEYAA